jgi:hypothetical protein
VAPLKKQMHLFFPVVPQKKLRLAALRFWI